MRPPNEYLQYSSQASSVIHGGNMRLLTAASAGSGLDWIILVISLGRLALLSFIFFPRLFQCSGLTLSALYPDVQHTCLRPSNTTALPRNPLTYKYILSAQIQSIISKLIYHFQSTFLSGHSSLQGGVKLKVILSLAIFDVVNRPNCNSGQTVR